MIQATASPLEWWPLALRHAAEEQFRAQLRQLGVPAPNLIGFGASVVVKQKTWFHRGVDWKFLMSRARCYGPAGDMSLTSGGYVLRTWVRSTVVIEPRDWQAQEERDAEVEAEDQARVPEAVVEAPMPRGAGDGGQAADTGEQEQVSLEESRPLFQVLPHDPPRRRVHGKSPPISQITPSLRSLREGGEKEPLAEEALQGADCEDLQRDAEAEHEVAVKQHRELKELMQEDEI